MSGLQTELATDDRDAVQRAMEHIGDLIVQRHLLPGQHVGQEELSQLIGISRGPVREALKALSAQQLLEYSRNRGYFVAQLRAGEMKQLYLLRRLAETQLLQSMREPSPAELDRLQAMQEDMRARPPLTDMTKLNTAFHLGILDLSPLKFIRAEVERWWALSSPYRALYLGTAGHEQLLLDHDAMLAALRAGDVDELIAVSDRHRHGSETALLPLLRD